MEKSIKVLLCEEIDDELQLLSSLTPGSAEHTAAIANIAKIHELIIEERKLEMEDESTIMDERSKEIHKHREEIIQYIRIGLEAAGIVLPLIFYGIWMRKGFKFEENGTFTSTTFRGLFNRFRPTK